MHIYERTYQIAMGTGMKFMPMSKQDVIASPGSLAEVPELLRRKKLKRPLIVSGPRVCRTEFFLQLIMHLKEIGLAPAVFTDVEPDPTTDMVQKVMERYRSEGCDSFIALGGGSNIDAAKAAAAGLARPDKSIEQLGGIMKVRRKTPYMIAVPTTAGTGSECTITAVVTDSDTNRKFTINDPVLCPNAAVLDANLTIGLPAPVVAATGMDALTHAVEAYLNRTYHKPGASPSRSSLQGPARLGMAPRGQGTGQLCLQAVHDIMLYLPFVYVDAVYHDDPQAAVEADTMETSRTMNRDDSSEQGYTRARQKMLEASYMAGRAFTVACVGNVHAIAHTLGGLYHIPHGVANAVLLPVVLEDYGNRVRRPLTRLAQAAGLEGAEDFIEQIRQMNREMGLPERFEQIREADLEQMAGWACQEANPLYPVPVIYDKADVKRILLSVSCL